MNPSAWILVLSTTLAAGVTKDMPARHRAPGAAAEGHAAPSAPAPVPADPELRIHTPGNTGIPGLNFLPFVRFDPQGRPWVGARTFFWGQGGVAALDPAADRWDTYSSVGTTLSQWCYDADFDAQGATWVGGDDNVTRIDANGAVTGWTAASSPLVNGPYTDVEVAPNGHVWAANTGSVQTGGGLFEFDGVSWTQHWEPWMLSWSGGVAPCIAVVSRPNGTIWATFGTLGNGMGRYKDGSWTRIEGAPTLLRMEEGPSGTLYGTDGFGTWRLNQSTGGWEQFGTIPSSNLAIDPVTEWIYVADDQFCYRWDGGGWSLFAQTPGVIGSIDVAGNGDVWIVAEYYPSHDAALRFDSSGNLLRGYNGPNTGVPDYLLGNLYHERDGTLWTISLEYGATRHEPDGRYRNFGAYNLGEEVFPFDLGPGQLLAEGVGGVFEDSQGNTWLISNGVARSHGDDLSQWDLHYWQNSILPSGFLSQMGEDAAGNVYVGGDFTAFRFDGEEWTVVEIGNPSQFAPIGFHQGLDGELYAYRIGTVYRFEGGTFVPLRTLNGSISQIAVAPNGDVWAGSNVGLQYWSAAGKGTLFTPANSGLSQLFVASVAVRPDGLVAAAYSNTNLQGGIAFYDGTDWTAFDYGSSALPHHQNGALSFDEDGNLWFVCTNFGAVQMMVGSREPANVYREERRR